MIANQQTNILLNSLIVACLAMPLANLASAQEANNGQQRVIEESLIYKDPSVARENQWVKGIALDYFNESAAFPLSGAMVKKTVSEPGVSAWVGYGDISVLFAHRKGSATLDSVLTAGGITANLHGNSDIQKTSIDVRWLMRSLSTSFLTPYVTLGYSRLETDTSTRTTAAGYRPFVANHSSTFDGPVYGIGAIVPVSEKIGFRIDAKYLTADGTFEDNTYSEGSVPSDYKSQEGTNTDAKQSILTATMYYNLTDHVNLQVGGMQLRQHSGDRRIDHGYFALLGYRF